MRWGFLFLSLVLCGCGKRTEAVPVSGTVTVAGRPLAGGMIVFTPDAEKGTNGACVAASIGSDGSYRLASNDQGGIRPGQYRIAVAPSVGDSKASSPLPAARYRRPDLSGLICLVRPGEANRFTFVLDAESTD